MSSSALVKDHFPLLTSGILTICDFLCYPSWPGLDVFDYRNKDSYLLMPYSTPLGHKDTSTQHRQVLQKTLKALNLGKDFDSEGFHSLHVFDSEINLSGGKKIYSCYFM